MLVTEINPYVRFARYLTLGTSSAYGEVKGLDARLFYTVSGQGVIEADGREYVMSAHSLLIINSGVTYRLAAPREQVRFIALNFDFTKSASDVTAATAPVDKNKYESRMLLDPNTFTDCEALSSALYVRDVPEVQQKLTAVINECTQKLVYYEEKSGHILAECIADVLRRSEIGTKGTESGADAILSFIHDNYRQSLSNEMIGERFNYHPNYISALVKRLTGMPLHRYILHVRLENAAGLLENTATPCEDIAALCGFCDAAHFSRCFKKYFGTSPSEYRSI